MAGSLPERREIRPDSGQQAFDGDDGGNDDDDDGDDGDDGDDDDNGDGDDSNDGDDNDDDGDDDDDDGLPAYSHQSYSHLVGICHNDEGWEDDTVTFPPCTMKVPNLNSTSVSNINDDFGSTALQWKE